MRNSYKSAIKIMQISNKGKTWEKKVQKIKAVNIAVQKNEILKYAHWLLTLLVPCANLVGFL